MDKKIALFIPARMESTRLPGKPLADIHGQSMIEHVWCRAIEAEIGDVFIAAGNQEIMDEAQKFGGKAIITRGDHPSGSDRIFEALTQIDPEKHYEYIVAFQGDIPTFNPKHLTGAIEILETTGADILTFVSKLDPIQYENANDVKALIEMDVKTSHGRALYFTRHIHPQSTIEPYYHIGLYIYKRAALESFVRAPESIYERAEKLEQLRALALGMHIEAILLDEIPLGVDTPEDLIKAREIIKKP